MSFRSASTRVLCGYWWESYRVKTSSYWVHPFVRHGDIARVLLFIAYQCLQPETKAGLLGALIICVILASLAMDLLLGSCASLGWWLLWVDCGRRLLGLLSHKSIFPHTCFPSNFQTWFLFAFRVFTWVPRNSLWQKKISVLREVNLTNEAIDISFTLLGQVWGNRWVSMGYIQIVPFCLKNREDVPLLRISVDVSSPRCC